MKLVEAMSNTLHRLEALRMRQALDPADERNAREIREEEANLRELDALKALVEGFEDHRVNDYGKWRLLVLYLLMKEGLER